MSENNPNSVEEKTTVIEDKPKKIFGLTFFITIIPAYIYFVSFEYELGYCNYFNIPGYLIEPSITTILIFATTIFGILFSSLKVLGISLPLFKAAEDENKTHLRTINFVNGICIFGTVLMMFAYPISWELLLICLIVTVLMNLLAWGLPFLFLLRQKKSIKEKLQRVEDEYVSSEDKLDWIDHLIKRFNREERMFFILIMLIPFISFLFGNGEAMKQEKFQIIANKVVLKKYNEVFICASFDRKTKILSDSLILVKLSESQPLILKTEKIGPLNVKY